MPRLHMVACSFDCCREALVVLAVVERSTDALGVGAADEVDTISFAEHPDVVGALVEQFVLFGEAFEEGLTWALVVAHARTITAMRNLTYTPTG